MKYIHQVHSQQTYEGFLLTSCCLFKYCKKLHLEKPNIIKIRFLNSVHAPKKLLQERQFTRTPSSRGGNSRRTSEMSDTTTQTASTTETKIDEMSDDPLLMNRKHFLSPVTSFQLSQNWAVRPTISSSSAE